MPSIPDRVARELEEHVLEIRLLGAETADPDAVFGQALNHFGDEAVAAPVNRELSRFALDVDDVRKRAETLLRHRILGAEHDRSIRAMLVDESLRRIDVDDAPVLDNRHAIA